LRLVAHLFMFLLIFNEQRVPKITFVLVLIYYVKPHLFVILTAIGWFIVNFQSYLFWHRCLERQALGTPRMYTLSPSKSIKGSNYGEFLKDKNVLLCTRLYKYAPNLESLLTQQYVCVMCTLWSDNTCVFTHFHGVKNANTQLIWSSVNTADIPRPRTTKYGVSRLCNTLSSEVRNTKKNVCPHLTSLKIIFRIGVVEKSVSAALVNLKLCCLMPE
jgi:hypothetical protein